MNWYADIDGKQYGPFADRAQALACVRRKIDLTAMGRMSLGFWDKGAVYDEYGRHDIEIYQE